MTRSEFDSKFAANLENTSDFTQDEIDDINKAVFAEVAALGADDSNTHRDVQAAFEIEFNRERP
jgi:hypothetical protein